MNELDNILDNLTNQRFIIAVRTQQKLGSLEYIVRIRPLTRHLTLEEAIGRYKKMLKNKFAKLIRMENRQNRRIANIYIAEWETPTKYSQLPSDIVSTHKVRGRWSEKGSII